MDLLRWTLVFLVLALIAAVFGFGGAAADFAYVGKILFFIFLVLFVVSLIFGRRRRL
ncbi:membrane protein [Acetobacter sp. DsW_063]|nr:membrane protein [Acetobacter sp. DsW_063]